MIVVCQSAIASLLEPSRDGLSCITSEVSWTLSSIQKEMQPLVQQACEDIVAMVCRGLFLL